MPVDYFPLLLALATAIGLLATAIRVYTHRRSNWRRQLLLGLIVTVPWPLLYAWMYHSADWRYSSAAARGDPEAEYRLGFAHMLYNHGTDHNSEEGRKLLEQSATSGNAKAQMALACFMISGLEMPQDSKRAVDLLQQAAPRIPGAATLLQAVRGHERDLDHLGPIADSILERWTVHSH